MLQSETRRLSQIKASPSGASIADTTQKASVCLPVVIINYSLKVISLRCFSLKFDWYFYYLRSFYLRSFASSQHQSSLNWTSRISSQHFPSTPIRLKHCFPFFNWVSVSCVSNHRANNVSHRYLRAFQWQSPCLSFAEAFTLWKIRKTKFNSQSCWTSYQRKRKENTKHFHVEVSLQWYRETTLA